MKGFSFHRLLALALLLLTLCGCSASGPERDPAAVPTPAAAGSSVPEAPAPTEPPIPDWLADAPVPDFLDPDQQELFLRAQAAASFLMGCEAASVDLDFPLFDGTMPEITAWETVTLDNGQTYLVSAGRYAQWDDFAAMLDGLFTPAYQQELLTTEMGDGTLLPRFTELEDGRMACLDVSRGSSLEYDWCDTPDSFELVSRSEEEILFDLVGHYADLTAEPDTQGLRPQYTQHYPIRMEHTDRGWRFSEFHVPY